MEGSIQKLFSLSFAIVLGMVATHPKTWRVELAKIQYSILKECAHGSNLGKLPLLRTSSVR